MFRKKKKKEPFEDDGRTVSNMNVEGFKWYESDNVRKNKESFQGKKLSAKESRRLFWQAFKSVGIPILCVGVGFMLAFMLCYIWLHR